jgi:hypothetical protein
VRRGVSDECREGESRGKNMKKKIMVLTLCVMLLAFSVSTEAQQGTIYRIGVLAAPGKAEERLEIKGLRAGLAEAGYVEGKNLQLNIPNVKTYDELHPSLKATSKEK